MELIPINETLEENGEFAGNSLCLDSLYMTIDFYKSVGFSPPWIGYYVRQNDQLVGSGGFKGRPINGQVEIAYGTFEQYQHQGVGAAICKLLVDLSLKTDSSVRITARTLTEKNFSTRILEKNSFKFNGIVNDQDDGDVWEWEYVPPEI
ncbi:MAG: GNAT family N-acetyltransferase [Bacteroidia bacterium]|nr:GNAT family N-acetyltransferase [Bacteroidia bacterium]